MRFGNLSGRATLFRGDLAYDVAKLSAEAFGPDPQNVLAAWPEFRQWAETVDYRGGEEFDEADLGAPTPHPGQVFAIGLNYSDHADEAGLDIPEDLTVFTKFTSCFSGPISDVTLSGPTVDWEVELVVVIGREASRVDTEDGWGYVAGLTVGQDISDRTVQTAGPAPQFSLGKSFPGYGPMGPWIVTPDELPTPDDLVIGATIDCESVQQGRTSDMIFGVADIVSRLSRVVTLAPGDIIFTGTPAGVGMGATPRRFLTDGEVLESRIEGIGTLRQRFVAEEAAS
ncbi:fumarylacetoacetate hydrolase family protein [Gordonia sp. NPDC003424]